MNSLNIKKGSEKGFTLLELLIVISIIAILSVALVLVLNPAEALKKSRDAQRISDLSTMKTALGLYLTSTSSPSLAGTASAGCKTNPTDAWLTAGTPKIYYSSAVTIAVTNLDGANGAVAAAASATPSTTDGLGWIPVNFDTLTGGSPISNIPVDPVNTLNGRGTGDVNSGTGPISNASLFYRYACSRSPLAFEMDASLESDAYTISEDKRSSDGGNSSSFYEVGTNLKVLGAGNNF